MWLWSWYPELTKYLLIYSNCKNDYKQPAFKIKIDIISQNCEVKNPKHILLIIIVFLTKQKIWNYVMLCVYPFHCQLNSLLMQNVTLFTWQYIPVSVFRLQYFPFSITTERPLWQHWFIVWLPFFTRYHMSSPTGYDCKESYMVTLHQQEWSVAVHNFWRLPVAHQESPVAAHNW